MQRSNGVRIPYRRTALEYEILMKQLGLNQLETGRMLGFSGRTSRRFKRGEVQVPVSVMKLMRLMADGVITRKQVEKA